MTQKAAHASPNSASGVPVPFANSPVASTTCTSRKKSAQTDYCGQGLSSRTKRLERGTARRSSSLPQAGHQGLVSRAPRPPGGADPHLVALAQNHRPQNAGRQGALRQERAEARLQKPRHHRAISPGPPRLAPRRGQHPAAQGVDFGPARSPASNANPIPPLKWREGARCLRSIHPCVTGGFGLPFKSVV